MTCEICKYGYGTTITDYSKLCKTHKKWFDEMRKNDSIFTEEELYSELKKVLMRTSRAIKKIKIKEIVDEVLKEIN